jgi:glycolate oxidase
VATYLAKQRGILLELRRMNHILEIDQKNMHAVVEPFVNIYQLQLELAKLGLYVAKPGVGYSASVISVACCHQEMTVSQIYTSGYGRNVLGCEWVLPDGEILNLGASNRDGGWFSGDGPGFSLRGILRGRAGANGGHGVITKCAVKLYPWYSNVPIKMMKRTHGDPPSAAQIDQVPDHYRSWVITFPSIDEMLKASTEIGQAELCCIIAPGYIESGFSEEGNDEQYAKQKQVTPDRQELIRNSVPVTINGHSERELDYREKAVMTIMKKWNGFLDPQFNNPKLRAQRFQYQMWSTGVPGLRATGDSWCPFRALTALPKCRLLIVRWRSMLLNPSLKEAL